MQFLENAVCPYCGKRITVHDWGYTCEGYRENRCKFKVSSQDGAVTEDDIRDLLDNGKTRVIPGIVKGKNGRTYDAALKLSPEEDQYATSYEFPERDENEMYLAGVSCPWCGGRIRKFGWGYACGKGKDACGFSVSGHDGKVTEKDVEDLVKNGTTRTITGLVKGKDGKLYNAAITLNETGNRYATSLSFQDNDEYVKGTSCPWCGGKVKRLKWGYACENSRDGGCGFKVSGYDGKLKEKDLKALIKDGETGMIENLVRSRENGKTYSAKVRLNEPGSEYATRLDFEW